MMQDFISNGINELICIGVNSDVVSCWEKVFEQYKEQTAPILEPELYNLPVDERCRAVFSYLARNVRYKLDPIGNQYIKTPARLLSDGEGDCKSLTMFIASCLYCLHVPVIVRFVNFDGGYQYSHVYPVAIDENGNEIVLDACETDTVGQPKYNYARSYSRHKDLRYE